MFSPNAKYFLFISTRLSTSFCFPQYLQASIVHMQGAHFHLLFLPSFLLQWPGVGAGQGCRSGQGSLVEEEERRSDSRTAVASSPAPRQLTPERWRLLGCRRGSSSSGADDGAAHRTTGQGMGCLGGRGGDASKSAGRVGGAGGGDLGLGLG